MNTRSTVDGDLTSVQILGSCMQPLSTHIPLPLTVALPTSPLIYLLLTTPINHVERTP